MNKGNAKRIMAKIEFAMFEIQGATGYSMERNRPYDGQPHTDTGGRGRTLVKGLTMRDVADCIVKAFLICGHVEKEFPVWDDVYKADLDDFDPIAVVQNALCEVERMMGIFPNVPKLLEKGAGDYVRVRNVVDGACLGVKGSELVVELKGGGITLEDPEHVTKITKKEHDEQT